MCECICVCSWLQGSSPSVSRVRIMQSFIILTGRRKRESERKRERSEGYMLQSSVKWQITWTHYIWINKLSVQEWNMLIQSFMSCEWAYRQDPEIGFKDCEAQLSHIYSRWLNEQLDHLFQYSGQINAIPHTHTPALPHWTRSKIKRLPEKLRVTWKHSCMRSNYTHPYRTIKPPRDK